jgi:hypothetical protein
MKPIKIPNSNWIAPTLQQERQTPTPWYLRPRRASCITIPKAKGPSNGDDFAKKYCFSAKIQLYTHVGSPPAGVIFSFDKNTDVSRQVEAVANAVMQETGFVCGLTEVIMHRECPSEVTDEVYVQLFDEARGLGSQDED